MKKTFEVKYEYCHKCGRKLEYVQDYANKYIESYSLDGWYKHRKYNMDTGKRQIIGYWKCPKARRWNTHVKQHNMKLV